MSRHRDVRNLDADEFDDDVDDSYGSSYGSSYVDEMQAIGTKGHNKGETRKKAICIILDH
jgi:hypothetical protein